MAPCRISLFMFIAVFAFGASALSPCCMPPQWSANLVETIGEYNRDLDAASLAYAGVDYYYDSTGNQVAYRESRDNQTMKIKSNRWVIMKFGEKTQYVIEKQNCVTSHLEAKMAPPCIPADATHLGTHSYPTGIMVDMWFFKDEAAGGTRRMGVTQDTCMPLSSSHISDGPDYLLTVNLYQNVTSGIKDPTVFNIPAFCKKQLAGEHIVEMAIEE